MIIYRCDVCAKEVVPDQPRFYALEPEGWFVKLGFIEEEGRKKKRHEMVHACSKQCAGELLKRPDVDFIAPIERKEWEKPGYVPKGSANCRNCLAIAVGKKCLWHGVKQPGWPEVPSVKVPRGE